MNTVQEGSLAKRSKCSKCAASEGVTVPMIMTNDRQPMTSYLCLLVYGNDGSLTYFVFEMLTM